MRRSLCTLVLGILIVSLAPSARAETMNLNLTFETRQQSMWGPSTAFTPSPKTFTIIDPNTVGWNYRTSEYPALKPGFESVDTYFWGEIEFGFGGRAATTAALGLWATTTVTEPGSVDVTYPVESTLVFPDANSFRAGDVVSIATSYDRGDAWEFKTTGPLAELAVDAKLQMLLDLHARACFVACADTWSAFGIPSPIFNFDYHDRLFTIRSGDGVSVPPILAGLSPITGSAGVPVINCSRADANCPSTAAGKSLHAVGDDDFITGTLKIMDVLKKLAGAPPIPMKVDTANFGLGDNVRFHYTLLVINLTAELLAAQQFAFDPDLKITLQFPREVEYWVVSGGVPGAHVTSTTAEMRVGDTINIVTPSDSKEPMPVTPSFRLDNTFTSSTRLEAAERLDVEAGDFGILLPELEIVPRLCTPGGCVDLGLGEVCVPEICTPRVTYDPPDYELAGDGALYQNTWNFGRQTLGTFHSGSWQMGGFNTHTTAALSVDPENPIIRVEQTTGAVRNLGEGKRLVPFAVDVANGGDVDLSSVTLQNSLETAFADARGFTVDHIVSCSLDVDPDYDGTGDAQILTGDDTLAVGESKRLIVYAVVSPQPDPAPYVATTVATGRSPLATLVEDDASSSVLLGPGTPSRASDFVLFGEHFVKLESAGVIQGHVGSNDFVEVKNGTSGNVAGDLRAGREIRVQGKISADYAISGGDVPVVGKGALTLYGNVKEFQNVPTVMAASPKFQPATPLAGDVWVDAGTPMTIDPGYYGNVTVNDGASLTLQPGRYHIESLVLAGGARVRASSATLVANDLQIAAGARLEATGRSRNLVVHALQNGAMEIGPNARIRADLTGVRSNLIFGRGARMEGSAFGRSITMMPGATASYHVDCDPVVDPDCDGSPDCPSL